MYRNTLVLRWYITNGLHAHCISIKKLFANKPRGLEKIQDKPMLKTSQKDASNCALVFFILSITGDLSLMIPEIMNILKDQNLRQCEMLGQF